MTPTAHPSGLALRAADLSLSRPPRWAWQDRIVLGSLNLLLGAEGCGKGTLAAWMIARWTCGELPGDLLGEPVTVGILGDEDGFDSVWVPRLHAAGADLSRVHLIERPDGGYVELHADRDRLACAVDLEQIRVLYLDALIDNLGASVDDWRAKQVRDALAPARQIARDQDVAVLGALHPNRSGSSFRQLMAGSIAFNAVSRSSLMLAEHPEDPDRRVLVRGKGNLSAAPDAVEFDIDGHRFTANSHTFNVPVARHFSTSDLTVDDLLTQAEPRPPAGEARETARDLIAEQLADGDWHLAAPIIDMCEKAGIYSRAARRAADDIGIERAKDGYPAVVNWRLAGQDPTHVSSVPSVHSVPSVDLALESRGDSKDSKDSADVCPDSVPTGERTSPLQPQLGDSGTDGDHGTLAEQLDQVTR